MNFPASIRDARTAPNAGWLTHDGVALPVAPTSQPGVVFRNGWRVPPGEYPASHWLEFGRDFWRHVGGPLDIVAFLPSYGWAAAALSHSAVSGMIRTTFGDDAGEGIAERLADDIIALLSTRGRSAAYGDLPDFFAFAK